MPKATDLKTIFLKSPVKMHVQIPIFQGQLIEKKLDR